MIFPLKPPCFLGIFHCHAWLPEGYEGGRAVSYPDNPWSSFWDGSCYLAWRTWTLQDMKYLDIYQSHTWIVQGPGTSDGMWTNDVSPRIDVFFGGKENMVFKIVLRTRETKKLERCHVNTFVKQVFEQSCAFYQFSPVTVPVHCRQWNVEGVQSLECEESGLLSGECRV